MEKLVVSSPNFKDKGLIPIENTGYGKDCSPELILSGLSKKTVSIAIIMDDMGHPIPAYNHWVIWNLPPAPVIPGCIPHGERVELLNGAIQGVGYGKNGYKGPKPPFNWSHVYHFNIYALDCIIDLPGTARKRKLLKAMQGHILQHAVLSGHYR